MKSYLIGLFFFSFSLLHCSPFQTIKGVSNGNELSYVHSDSLASSNESLSLDLETDFFTDDNAYIDKWIKYFSEGAGRSSMLWRLERSTRYISLMKNILKQNNVPTDLAYIPIIESGFNGQAVSSANAVGYWQFLDTTGRRFGLKIDSLVDERRDHFRSTEAAAKYLKYLHSVFGNWYLALAGYNAGETALSSFIIRNGNRNFWNLAENKKLPKETIDFIPKIIAAIRIAKNPSEYGFMNLNYNKPLDYFRLNLKKPTQLTKLSSEFKIEHEKLKELNLKFMTDSVPLNKNGEVTLRIPTEAIVKQ